MAGLTEPKASEPYSAGAARMVLVTRPEEAAAETAERLRALGYLPILAPLLDIHRLPCALPDPAELQAILVTSARALPALTPAYSDLPLLTVGDATAARARSAGHTCVESADGNAADLLRLALARCDSAGAALLLLSGQGEGADLASRLAVAFRLVQCFVYRATPAANLPPAARAALCGTHKMAGEVVSALFFSAATARSFVTLAEAAGLRDTVRKVEALAISAETEAALAGLPWRSIRRAARPNQDELLALLR